MTLLVTDKVFPQVFLLYFSEAKEALKGQPNRNIIIRMFYFCNIQNIAVAMH